MRHRSHWVSATAHSRVVGLGERTLSILRTMSTMDDVRRIVDDHASAGSTFEADGVRSFVRTEGGGDPVLCVHGVPMSSFLYRKVLAELAARGLRGVAVDLPGLGLADRPADRDYSWTGLGRFLAAAVDELGLDRYHLVVHDVGGPVGFELAAAHATASARCSS